MVTHQFSGAVERKCDSAKLRDVGVEHFFPLNRPDRKKVSALYSADSRKEKSGSAGIYLYIYIYIPMQRWRSCLLPRRRRPYNHHQDNMLQYTSHYTLHITCILCIHTERRTLRAIVVWTLCEVAWNCTRGAAGRRLRRPLGSRRRLRPQASRYIPGSSP